MKKQSYEVAFTMPKPPRERISRVIAGSEGEAREIVSKRIHDRDGIYPSIKSVRVAS